MSHSLQPHGLEPSQLLSPWAFPGKNTAVGNHFFLQGSSLPRHWSHISLSGVSCITTSTLFNLYVSLSGHTFLKSSPLNIIMNSWPFTDSACLNGTFIAIIIFYCYDYMWVPPYDHCSDHLQEHPCLCRSRDAVSGIHPPCKGYSFLWVDGSPWVPMWVGKMLLDSVCLRSQFTLIILVSPCFHAYFSRELGFIYTNMFLHWHCPSTSHTFLVGI